MAAERGPKLMRLLVRALVHPELIFLLLRAGWRFRARRWWLRPPFLPVPPAEYLAWRLHTAYGESGVAPELEELERYLRWVVWMNRGAEARRGRGRA